MPEPQSLELNSALFDTVGAVLMVLDREARIVRFNRAAQEFMGYRFEEVRDQPYFWTRFLPPGCQDEVMDVFRRLCAGEEVPTHDNPWLNRSGESRLFEWRNTMLFDAGGQVTHVITLGVDVTQARLDEARLRDSEQRILRELAERQRLEREVVDIGTAEQERIGREIHDGLGQQLTALAMLCSSLRQRLLREGHAAAAESVEHLERRLQGVTAEARALARGLSPIRLDGSSLATALRALVEDASAGSAMACDLRISGAAPGLDEVVATHLYRIAQEALHNALKHARAHQVRVELELADERVRLEVRDDGVGLPESRRDNLGLPIMRHRAALIGAALQVESSPSAGTIVRCLWSRGRTSPAAKSH